MSPATRPCRRPEYTTGPPSIRATVCFSSSSTSSLDPKYILWPACKRKIGYGIVSACFSKGALAQHAALAYPASFIFAAVTGPGQIKRSIQLQSQLYNLGLAHGNERGHDHNPAFPCARFYDCIERLIIRGTAIRISRAVLL